jgi:hypothetical protein
MCGSPAFRKFVVDGFPRKPHDVSQAYRVLQFPPMPGDEKDLIKAGVDAALAPVKDLANRLFGPAIDELGAIFAEPIRMLRFKRSVRLMEKVKRICDETGFEPRAVPLKTLLPILENASLEGDEDLHDRWANLLANAASPDGPSTVLPSFPDILRQLTTPHAVLMDTLYEMACIQAQASFGTIVNAAAVSSVRLADKSGLLNVANSLSFPGLFPDQNVWDESRCLLIVDELVRLRLLSMGTRAEPSNRRGPG